MKNKTLQPKNILILGAGLAGLATGYELVKAGFRVTIVEKEEAVGGLARTIEKNGFRFDTGPHRWYTKSDMVNSWMLKLLGNEVIKVPRLTRIYFDQQFFEYPIKIKTTFEGIGVFKTLQSVLDYAIVRIVTLFYKKDPVTLEEGYISKFGRTLYKTFFQRYSEKLWGTSCKNISADWIGQRTRGFNIATIIKETLFKSKRVVSFVDEFSYPKKGIGQIAEKLAAGVKEGGGSILLNSEVVEITRKQNTISQVTIKQKKSNRTFKIEAVVSSIPISELITALKPTVPQTVLKINQKLTYRDELQVALFIKKTHITPDTWIYVHSFDIPFVRMMEMDNWSQQLSPPGTTTLLFEIACNEGDAMWNKTDKQITELVTASFITEFQLITQKDVIGSYVHRMPKEYPVYHIGYKKDVEELKKFLKQFTNLQLVGRNGTFRYNNMDHSIEMGLYAAWNLIDGEEKFNIESVNIEREYLEEKKINSKEIELSEDQLVEEEKH